MSRGWMNAEREVAEAVGGMREQRNRRNSGEDQRRVCVCWAYDVRRLRNRTDLVVDNQNEDQVL